MLILNFATWLKNTDLFTYNLLINLFYKGILAIKK